MNIEALEIRNDKIAQFANRGIETIEDLLCYMPKKFYDFRKPKKFYEIKDGDTVCVVGKIESIEERHGNRGSFIVIQIRDDERYYYTVMYFNSHYIMDKFAYGDRVAVCGKPKMAFMGKKRSITFTNPMVMTKDVDNALCIKPVYKKIQGMSDQFFETCLKKALAIGTSETYKDYLEIGVLQKYGLIDRREMYFDIHFPKTPEDIKKAKIRLLFDDLFTFNMMLEYKKTIAKNDSNYILRAGQNVKRYLEKLPYKLTDGQKSAVVKLINKSKDGKRINALVQGDVGCGKTEVAKIMMLSAVDANYQAFLLAPTVVLANQHYEDFCKSMEHLGVRIALLTSNLKKSERNKIIKQIAKREVDIVIGTHSLLSDDIEVSNLALFITDEEHRFGVKQREKIVNKLQNGVHSISMSATPIPRTLAMSMYGDNIDIIEIKTMPNGRKPIKTKSVQDPYKALEVLNKAIQAGNQAYVVCPLIDSDEDSDVVDVNTVYKDFCRYFRPKGVTVTMVNGSMKEDEIKKNIESFKKGESKILISTTVIEVGVNVPQANIMWIKDADRFGLAQLHQLRGRVGRGDKQGYCWIESSSESERSLHKLEIFKSSTDGFYLATEDLKMRGAGDFIGTVQSGDNKYINLVLSYPKINEKVKKEISLIYQDPQRRRYYEDILFDQLKELKNNMI